MKKFSFLIVVLVFITSVACSKEESDVEETLGIAGEWNLEEFQYQGTTTVKMGDMQDISTYVGTSKDIDVQLVLNSQPDNTWEQSGSYTIQLAIMVNVMKWSWWWRAINFFPDNQAVAIQKRIMPVVC